jgi:hypothetical protein
MIKRCVDGYREALGMARARRLQLQREKALATSPTSPKISRVNRVVSKRLLPKNSTEIREGIWHLSMYLRGRCLGGVHRVLTSRNRLEAGGGLTGVLGGIFETLAEIDEDRTIMT